MHACMTKDGSRCQLALGRLAGQRVCQLLHVLHGDCTAAHRAPAICRQYGQEGLAAAGHVAAGAVAPVQQADALACGGGVVCALAHKRSSSARCCTHKPGWAAGTTRTPHARTCGNVKGDDALAADALQLALGPRQAAVGAGAEALGRLVPAVRLAHHELDLLAVLVRHLGAVLWAHERARVLQRRPAQARTLALDDGGGQDGHHVPREPAAAWRAAGQVGSFTQGRNRHAVGAWRQSAEAPAGAQRTC
jgi:hypothetical protein